MEKIKIAFLGLIVLLHGANSFGKTNDSCLNVKIQLSINGKDTTLVKLPDLDLVKLKYYFENCGTKDIMLRNVNFGYEGMTKTVNAFVNLYDRKTGKKIVLDNIADVDMLEGDIRLNRRSRDSLVFNFKSLFRIKKPGEYKLTGFYIRTGISGKKHILKSKDVMFHIVR